MRLAIITTHPIQYYAPVFKLLQQRSQLEIMVFYTWGKSSIVKFDPGFGQMVEWDTPLLDSYPYKWVENTSPVPGSYGFKGIVNPVLNNDIEEWQADAILVYGWAYKSHLKAIRYFKNKIPVYFRGDSTLLDDSKGLKAILRSVFLKWVYTYVDHAFYVGFNNKAYFKKHGLKDSQLTFAPHAVDNDKFADDKTNEANSIRQGFGVNEDDILILFAGKLEEKKSPHLLLTAFLALNQPKTHLLFVGDGLLKTSLVAIAGNYPNVHFMGFQNQSAMPSVYQACDLFCLPSTGPGETWGLAVNEAMACGKAVLVSDKVGCAVDLARVGVNGYIFKGGDQDELLYYLSELTASKSILQKFGKRSAEIIKKWNFTEIAMAIEGVLLNPQLSVNIKNAK